MNKYFKAFIITTAVIAALLFLAYKIFFSIDFIGTKDPKVVKENLERQKNMLIKADFRSGKFYCELELLDSFNLFIHVGNSAEATMWEDSCKLEGDTIIAKGGFVSRNEYLNSDTMIINGDRIIFLKDENGNFDTTRFMTIQFNKLEK